MKKNLAACFYVDPEYFVKERHRLFSKSWQFLAPSDTLSHAGAYVSEDFAGIKIVAIRGKDGELRAFRNVCRHRGAQLIDRGIGRCQMICCPYHNWAYDDTGNLKHAPWFGEEQNFSLNDWPLEPVHINEWRGLVFISIRPSVPLENQLGAAASELRDVPIESYSHTDSKCMQFSANWKIYTDNFVEGYHIPGIHPEFYDAIDFESFETTTGEGLVKMTAPAKNDLFYKGRWYWMWPNWTLSLFEGGMNTSRINPISETETELLYYFYFADTSESSADFRQQTILKNIEVIRQDFQICLDVHRNYQSDSYRPGPLSPRHEKGVDYFQSRYIRSMELSA